MSDINLMAEKLSLPQVLRSGRQADPDGVEVRISRQAVEEAATQLEQLHRALQWDWTEISKDALGEVQCALKLSTGI